MKAPLSAVIALLWTGLALAFATARVEPAPPLPESVPAAIRNAVDAKGLRVSTEAGPIADLWLRASVPAGAKQEAGSVLYSQLAPGTFVGIVSLVKPWTDFRGQSVAAGFYTVRYELLPEDGNHMGVAPNRDFLLLVPVAADPGPGVQTKYQDLVKLSGKASGAAHPAVMAMVQATGASQPSVSTNADGFVIFSATAKTTTGELPVAVVLNGQGQQ